MANYLHEVMGQASARLAISPQTATARRDAELLLLHTCGISRSQLMTHPETPLTPAQLENYFLALERRAQSEPIQYITGIQEFYGLPFRVTPAVLIPRPETEHLVEAAIAIARQVQTPLSILDIGTGSGAIAVALAHALPQASIIATDISPDALIIAQENAERNGVAGRITFTQCDLLPTDGVLYDMICSNPPYISAVEVLEPQVAAFEPHTALFAGPTGLEIYERLLPLAAASLYPGGNLLLEIGYGQSSSIESLLPASDWLKTEFIADLQGIPRVAVVQKRRA